MNTIDLVTLFCALACGLVGGFFFAFSCCVMKSLAELPPAHGIAGMQAINRVVINPWFLVPFLGMAVACLPIVVVAWLRWRDGWSTCSILGSGLYLIGTFGVTMSFNVPLNDALARVAAQGPEGEALWRRYLSTWTRWNHVRTAAALGACAAFCVALWARG